MDETKFLTKGLISAGVAASSYIAQRLNNQYTSTMARTWEDEGSFKQLQKRVSKRGYYATDREREQLLINASAVRILFRFQGIFDIAGGAGGAANGFTWIGQHIRGDGLVDLPIHLIPLFNVNQGFPTASGIPAPGDQVGVGHYKLTIDDTGGANNGNMQWVPVAGTTTAGVNTDRIDIAQNNMAAGEQYVSVGRKSLCDWTRAKFMFRGKTSEPSVIRVSVVRFLEDRYCPEINWTGTNNPPLTNLATELFTSRVRPLLSNPIAAYPVMSETPDSIAFLDSKTIMVNPSDTTDNDPRGHFKVLTLFNRWNRVVNYTRPNTSRPGWGTLRDTMTAIVPKQTGYAGVPRVPKHNVYIMIESLQPTATGGALAVRNTANTVSFDFNIEMSHTVLEQSRTTAAPS